MKIIKTVMGWAASFFILALALGIGAYYMLYDSFDDFKADIDTGIRNVRLELFSRGYIKEVTRDEVRAIYQKRCYRQCHGEAAMITAVLSPAGWIQVVERMRVKENVEISGREADEIIKYLEDTYPTVKTGFPYEIRKKVHEAVWRNDVGQGDIYCDVNYATPEYLISIGAKHLIDEYDLENYHVFITSFTVHEGEIELFDLDKVSFIRSDSKTVPSTPDWILRFQTADKHHFEAVIRFAKESSESIISGNSKWFELVVKNVGGSKDRVFRWNLPIKYPKEVEEQFK